MKILHMEQGSDEWFAARCGIPSASNFSKILANGKGGAPSKTRLSYLRELAGERITGARAENYTNHHMERGKEMEAEARNLYTFATDSPVEQVGFVLNYGAGASPDGLVGDDGLLEIKTALPRILIEHLEAATTPPEHVAQIQGQMWVAERQWCDLLIYWPAMPPFQIRVERDDGYIDETLAPSVAEFIDDLETLVTRHSSREST